MPGLPLRLLCREILANVLDVTSTAKLTVGAGVGECVFDASFGL